VTTHSSVETLAVVSTLLWVVTGMAARWIAFV